MVQENKGGSNIYEKYRTRSTIFIFAASIWGDMYVVSKYVLDYVPPLTLVWLRYIIAFFVLYGILLFTQDNTKTRVPLAKKDWFLLAIFFALIFTTPLMLWELNKSSIALNAPLIIPGILYLGIVSTAGAFFLWNKGMEMMEAGIGSLFFFFQPLVGSFLGWLLLGEHLDRNFFLGGALILLGVLIVTLQKEE